MQTCDLDALKHASRLLFTIPLKPRQGSRFQPTGFPSLGAATYQTPAGTSLLVESAQSMANRLEATCWDAEKNQVHSALSGISHVRVMRKGEFLTDTLIEAHRINSPYILENSEKSFFTELKKELGGLEEGPVNRKKLAQVLFNFDINSLLHGVFLAKPGLAGGRLRIARAISAFVEADGVRVAASGGVKNDHVNPTGDSVKGFGTVPFARDEYTAENLNLYVNVDLAQLRGYGLDEQATRLLMLLALFKIRRLLEGELRFRTACDLTPVARDIIAESPAGWALPELSALEQALKESIRACSKLMKEREVRFEDALKKGSESDSPS